MHEVAQNGDVMAAVLSFAGCLRDVAAMRACCRSWVKDLLNPLHQATAHLFQRIEEHFNQSVSDKCIQSSFATEALRVLQLTGCRSVTDVGVAWLATLAPCLEVLDVSRCDRVSDYGLHYVAAHCKLLVSLDISHLPRMTDQNGLAKFIACPQLRHINVTQTAAGNYGLSTVAMYSALLESICGCRTNVGGTGLRRIATFCPHLQQLYLDDCSNAYNYGAAAMGEHIQDYTQDGNNVALPTNDHINDQSLAVLARRCPSLRVLEIAHAGDVTDEGVIDLGRTCRRLERLNLWGCNKVTFSAVNSLQLSGVEVSHPQARTCRFAM